MPTLTSGLSLRIAFLVTAAVSSIGAAVAACADPDTLTPTCTNNVTSYGMVADADGGCAQFPMCTPNGDATTCCTGADGGTLTGNDLATCLYGYGDPSCLYLIIVYSNMGTDMAYTCSTTPPPDAGTGGSGTGGSSSSSSSNSTSSSSSGKGGSDGGDGG